MEAGGGVSEDTLWKLGRVSEDTLWKLILFHHRVLGTELTLWGLEANALAC